MGVTVPLICLLTALFCCARFALLLKTTCSNVHMREVSTQPTGLSPLRFIRCSTVGLLHDSCSFIASFVSGWVCGWACGEINIFVR